MPILIDSDVAIRLRDVEHEVLDLLDAHGAPFISAITLCELEAGTAADDSIGKARRALLNAMLDEVVVLPFTSVEATAYGRIVAAIGFDRRRVLDRMIAAQAIVAGLSLATFNGHDFVNIPNLSLQIWSL